MKKHSLRIGLVELYATMDGGLWSPRMRDLYSLVHLPSRAVDLLAAILRKEGFGSVKTFNPLYNDHGGRFHAADLEELASMDVVGLSAITRTQPPSYELARRLKELNPRIRIVFGGPHVTALPEEGLEYGDVVVRREGDATLPELLERIEEDPENPCFDGVAGISYRDGSGEAVHNPDRPFLTNEQLTALPFPDFPDGVRKGIDNSVIVTSRGCPYQCDFCSVVSHFGSGYRFIEVDRTVELIEHVLAQTRKPIFFGDDNFNARPSRTKAVLEKILRKGIEMPTWGAQVRVEAAWDRELLSLMKRAGCATVYVGFESINPASLLLFNKRSSREKNEEAIRRFHEAGISIHGMFVLGSDADTVETIKETVAFAKGMGLETAQFFALTPLPGTPMTARYLEQGKVLSKDWHLYDAHHVTIRPAGITPYQLQRELTRAHLSFYSWPEAFRHLLFGRSDRWANAKIRFLGYLLAKRIAGEMRGHERQLGILDHWADEVESRYERLWRQVGGRVQSLGKGISSTAEPVRVSVEEFAGWLRRSLEALPREFLPYCNRLAASKIEGILEVLPGLEDPGVERHSFPQGAR